MKSWLKIQCFMISCYYKWQDNGCQNLNFGSANYKLWWSMSHLLCILSGCISLWGDENTSTQTDCPPKGGSDFHIKGRGVNTCQEEDERWWSPPRHHRTSNREIPIGVCRRENPLTQYTGAGILWADADLLSEATIYTSLSKCYSPTVQRKSLSSSKED